MKDLNGLRGCGTKDTFIDFKGAVFVGDTESLPNTLVVERV